MEAETADEEVEQALRVAQQNALFVLGSHAERELDLEHQAVAHCHSLLLVVPPQPLPAGHNLPDRFALQERSFLYFLAVEGGCLEEAEELDWEPGQVDAELLQGSLLHLLQALVRLRVHNHAAARRQSHHY